jgi:hypothetical protein
MYFKTLPNLEYRSKLVDSNSSLDKVTAKNFFRRGKIRADIFQNASFFTKYSIIGDERPDQVSEKFYGSPLYDWVILLTNNILDVYNEWPLSQQAFYDFLIQKYGSEEEFYQVKHYKTLEVRNSTNQIVQNAGLIVDNTFYGQLAVAGQAALEYYDENLGVMVQKAGSDISVPVTFLDYEEEINDNKRNIFVLREIYLQSAINDLEDISTYKQSSDYISSNLKKTDNINLTGL